MSRIVIDARIINSSTGRYVERLLTYLQSFDKENEYIILVPKKDLSYWKPTNKNFTIKEANFGNYSFDEQFGLAKMLYSLKPDLVHFCMPQQPLFYFGKHITTLHDLTLLQTYNSDKNWLIFHLKQLVGHLVFQWIGRSSQFILTPTKFTAKEYQNYSKINENKIKTIYLAADSDLFKPKKPARTYKDFIMYVGQQSDYKNIRQLIKVHQEVIKAKPNLELILVGGKNKLVKMNEKWVKDKGFKNIYFAGFVPDDELSWLYKNTQAYVFPSLMEGFGLPPLEAMNYGAPVVSSNASCLPEVNGKAAHYFNPRDTKDMTHKIITVLDDKKLREKLIKNGYNQVKKYSWAKTAKQTHEVYLQALRNE